MPESAVTGKSSTRSASYARSASVSDEGTIYQLAKGRNIKINQEFDTQRKSGEMQISQRNQALENTGVKGRTRNVFSTSTTGMTFSSGSIFSGKELARANRFAAHINGSGNLLKNPGISARNEEVIGYLAAITTIKGQMYAATSGKENAMNVPIKNALNQMIDYHLSQKGVYKVYDYTTNAYERTKSPQKALEEGLEYAYTLFREKKKMRPIDNRRRIRKRQDFFRCC